MVRFLLKRLFVLIPTLLGVSFISFIMIRLIPGDPVLMMLGERGASPETIARMRANLDLDKPLLVQYGSFLKRAAAGDLGDSVVSRRPVVEEFWSRFPATVELSAAALFFALLIGVPLGILAAVKRNSLYDFGFMSLSLVGYSMPIFWWGLILILVFSVSLGWTPVAGRMSVIYEVVPTTGLMLIDTLKSEERWSAWFDALKHLVLPAMAMGTIPLAVLARMTRSSLLEVLDEDYVRTARSKGLNSFSVIVVHGLRNALIPIVTILGLLIGSFVTGAILTESIFSWPGIGKWLVKSVEARDYPVIQGGVLFIATMIVLVNLLVDLVYFYINPRLRENA